MHSYLKRIRDLREDNDKTQREIAELLNMQLTVYQRYERGERELPLWAAIKQKYCRPRDYVNYCLWRVPYILALAVYKSVKRFYRVCHHLVEKRPTKICTRKNQAGDNNWKHCYNAEYRQDFIHSLVFFDLEGFTHESSHSVYEVYA